MLFNGLLKLGFQVLTQLLFTLHRKVSLLLGFIQSTGDLLVSSLQLCDVSVLLLDLIESAVKFGLNVMRIALAFILLSQAILVSSVGFVQYLNLNMKFLNLLTESLLDGVSVQETLNLLFTEEEFFLDHGLHIGVAINDSLQELCEVGTLGLLAVLLGP